MSGIPHSLWKQIKLISDDSYLQNCGILVIHLHTGHYKIFDKTQYILKETILALDFFFRNYSDIYFLNTEIFFNL